MAEGQRHAEHLVNTLDGEEGQYFNDWDRDGQFQNPGDGFGLRVYLDETQAVLLALQDLLDSPDVPTDAAAQVATALAAIANSQDLVAAATETALQVISANTVEDAQVLGDELRQTAALVADDTASAFDAIAALAEFRFYAPADVLAATQSAEVLIGQLHFEGNDAAEAGNYILELARVPEPPAGSHYELWLGTESGELLNLGELTVEDARVNAAGRTEQNLLLAYDRVLISLNQTTTIVTQVLTTSRQTLSLLAPSRTRC